MGEGRSYYSSSPPSYMHLYTKVGLEVYLLSCLIYSLILPLILQMLHYEGSGEVSTVRMHSSSNIHTNGVATHDEKKNKGILYCSTRIIGFIILWVDPWLEEIRKMSRQMKRRIWCVCSTCACRTHTSCAIPCFPPHQC